MQGLKQEAKALIEKGDYVGARQKYEDCLKRISAHSSPESLGTNSTSPWNADAERDEQGAFEGTLHEPVCRESPQTQNESDESKDGADTQGKLSSTSSQDLANLHLNMALCDLKLRNFESAREQAQAAVKLGPTNPSKAYFRQAEAAFQLNDVEGALEALKNVTLKNQKDPAVSDLMRRIIEAAQPADPLDALSPSLAALARLAHEVFDKRPHESHTNLAGDRSHLSDKNSDKILNKTVSPGPGIGLMDNDHHEIVIDETSASAATTASPALRATAASSAKSEDFAAADKMKNANASASSPPADLDVTTAIERSVLWVKRYGRPDTFFSPHNLPALVGVILAANPRISTGRSQDERCDSDGRDKDNEQLDSDLESGQIEGEKNFTRAKRALDLLAVLALETTDSRSLGDSGCSAGCARRRSILQDLLAKVADFGRDPLEDLRYPTAKPKAKHGVEIEEGDVESNEGSKAKSSTLRLKASEKWIEEKCVRAYSLERVALETVRAGIGGGPGSVFRAAFVESVIRLCQYTRWASDSLRVLLLGLDCLEAPGVRNAAALALGRLCNDRRAEGLHVPPLLVKNELLKVLKSLISYFSDVLEGDSTSDTYSDANSTSGLRPDVENLRFVFLSLFAILSDADRAEDEKVDWRLLLEDCLITLVRDAPAIDTEQSANPGLAKPESAEYVLGYTVLYNILNILWLVNKEQAAAFAILTSLPVTGISQVLQTGSRALRQAAVVFVSQILERRQAREQVLVMDNILELLVEKQLEVPDLQEKLVLLQILSKFTLHDATSLKTVLRDADVFPTLTAAAERLIPLSLADIPLSTLSGFFQVIFDLSTHAEFGTALLSLDPAMVAAMEQRAAALLGDGWRIENDVCLRPELRALVTELTLKVREGVEDEEKEKAKENEGKLRLLHHLCLIADRVTAHPLSESNLPPKATALHSQGSDSDGRRFEWRDKVSKIRFQFIGIVHNLCHSKADKGRLKRSKDGPDFDDEQMQQLEMLYEKLPSHARPQQETTQVVPSVLVAQIYKDIFLGSERSATGASEEERSAIKIMKRIVRENRDTGEAPTQHIVLLACRLVRMFCFDAAARSRVFKDGGFAILKTALSRHGVSGRPHAPNSQGRVDDEDARDVLQTVARLAVGIEPRFFRYEERMDLTSCLMPLLSDRHELFSYEACLALVNLSSAGGDVQLRVFDSGRSWHQIMENVTSENIKLRTAALELVCNLSTNDEIVFKIVQKVMADGAFHFVSPVIAACAFDCENFDAALAAQAFLAAMVVAPPTTRILLRHRPALSTNLLALASIASASPELSTEQSLASEKIRELAFRATFVCLRLLDSLEVVYREACEDEGLTDATVPPPDAPRVTEVVEDRTRELKELVKDDKGRERPLSTIASENLKAIVLGLPLLHEACSSAAGNEPPLDAKAERHARLLCSANLEPASSMGMFVSELLKQPRSALSEGVAEGGGEEDLAGSQSFERVRDFWRHRIYKSVGTS